MKFTKLLPLSLVAFVLFGCSQSSAVNQESDTVQAANTIQEENSPPQQITTNNQVSSPPIVAQNRASRNSSSGNIRIEETSYDSALKSLNSLTKGCQETRKTLQKTNYYICKKGDEIVKASASSATLGDGNEYWFADNRVIAVQQFHTGELFVYDKNGKLKSKFDYPKKVRNISNRDIQIAERLYNGYDYIFDVFSNNSTRQTTTSQKVETTRKQSSSKYASIEELKELDEQIRRRNGRIIGSATCDNDGLENDYRVDFDGDGMPDECVTANARMHPLILQDDINFVRDTVNSLEKGSQVTSKEQGNFTYYLWKKNGEIVKAIKSKKGSATSVQYWFYLGKPFAVQRIDDSTRSTVKNTIFIYDKNGNLYSVYEVFGGEGDNSKHITKFSNQQLQEAERLFNGYQEIFNVF